MLESRVRLHGKRDGTSLRSELLSSAPTASERGRGEMELGQSCPEPPGQALLWPCTRRLANTRVWGACSLRQRSVLYDPLAWKSKLTS